MFIRLDALAYHELGGKLPRFLYFNEAMVLRQHVVSGRRTRTQAITWTEIQGLGEQGHASISRHTCEFFALHYHQPKTDSAVLDFYATLV